MDQTYRIVLPVIAAKAVGTDQLCEAIALMRRCRVAASTHFGQTNADTAARQLPCGLTPSHAATNDVNLIVSHTASLNTAPNVAAINGFADVSYRFRTANSDSVLGRLNRDLAKNQLANHVKQISLRPCHLLRDRI
jgi:hypothetical protein